MLCSGLLREGACCFNRGLCLFASDQAKGLCSNHSNVVQELVEVGASLRIYEAIRL